VQPAGFSASLSKHAALEQALLEALQYKHRYNVAAEEFRQDILLHYQQRPLLIKAMQCDLQAVMTADKYVYCRWDSIPAYPLNTLAEQIKLMSRLLTHGGFEIYYSDLYRGESGVALVYVLVTGLERFFLIKDGKFFPPGLRGKMAME
jgi:ribosomal protein S12 methylthiotransferase accessory factor YcaO